MNDSNFAGAFRKLIVARIGELVNDAQLIAESEETKEFKMLKLDKSLDMINHNFKVYSMFFKAPYGQKESILENLESLYRMH